MTQLPPSPPTGLPAGMKPHRGTTVLVLGILGLVCCFPLGIAAWVMGNNDLKEIDAGRMDPTGRGTTNAGKICGMIATILAIVGIVVQIIVLVTTGGTLFQSIGR